MILKITLALLFFVALASTESSQRDHSHNLVEIRKSDVDKFEAFAEEHGICRRRIPTPT